MSETHYLISDASKKVDVESHVLRYWEEELEMAIPRNEMGHRYYTDFHIRLFKQIKELKEKGYQLKAIKAALAKSLDQDGEAVIPTDVLEEDVVAALKECTDQESREMEKLDDRCWMDDLRFYSVTADSALDLRQLPAELRQDYTPILRRYDCRQWLTHDYLGVSRVGKGRIYTTTLRVEGGQGKQPKLLMNNRMGLYLLDEMLTEK